jgi:hypothetical protein
MNGAIAVPSVKTIRTPKNTKKMMIGASHHFLRSFKKVQNSDMIDSFDIIHHSFI